MSQSLAGALGKFNITVGVVAPGFVETDMAAPYLQSEAGDLVKKQSPLNRVATLAFRFALVIYILNILLLLLPFFWFFFFVNNLKLLITTILLQGVN
jgi:NAD(P)-dependent dehydrogenase (short-subunit alcohol dehydrogenase family)